MRAGYITVHIVAALLACLAVPVSSQTRKIDRTSGRDLPPSAGDIDVPFCAADVRQDFRQGLNVSRGLPDGEPLSFQQVPPILRPDHVGSFGLLEFAVLGDYEAVIFERQDPSAESGAVVERWQRTTSTTVSGRMVSLFEPRWADHVWSERLRHERHGFDRPYVFWGRVVIPSSNLFAGPEKRPLYLRVGSTGVPLSYVRQIAPDVQYASHVVNLVIPAFGDSRVSLGTYDFDLPTAANAFYRHFSDTYDSIAFIPQRSHVPEFGGFHLNVKNDIEGIGKPIVDQSHLYGSAGRLRSVEVYPQGQFTTNEGSSHEIAHQWGDGFDWSALGAINRGGWHPSSHTPLLYQGATLIGAVLRASRRVTHVDPARFEIERTTGPMRFHPLQMYRMGHLAVGDVPDVLVFADQDQLAPHGTRLPAPGVAVTGLTNRVTIENIVAHHGPRRGSIQTVWRRATVVVSRDALLSQVEMDYWNFFAQRLEDPNRTGVASYDRYPSFDALTGHRVDLQTDITPRTVEKIVQPLLVDFPAFGRRDWRGVEFDTPVLSRYRAGERVRLSGRVTTTNDQPVDKVLVRFWKHDASGADALRFWAAVNPNGSFSVDVDPGALQTGSYSLGVFLFWPDSGPQFPRGMLSPAIVE